MYPQCEVFRGHLLEGHRLHSLCVDISLPLYALIFLLLTILITFIRNPWIRKPLQVLFFLPYIALLPNAPYLASEIRHVWLVDKVLEPLTVTGLALFGLISLLGVALTTGLILLDIALLPYLKKHPTLKVGILSFLSMFGTALGLRFVNSTDLFYNLEKVARQSWFIVTHFNWIGSVLLGTLALTVWMIVVLGTIQGLFHTKVWE